MLIFAGILLGLQLSFASAIDAYAEKETSGNDDGVIKICIDPGHGGENEGAKWGDYLEKDMTMIVANSMKEELSKYEGIEVVMTRESDKDMTLEERVEFAADEGADFFFCLHFNMSEEHDLYGAECWISAFGENYARAYDFSTIEMKLLTDTGLYDRGIKTRLNSKGTNYYGVLRFGDLNDIPGVIIEHCHLDNEEDEPYYDHHDLLVEYGKLDAKAVAMYYGLKSEETGEDYSDYVYKNTPVPDSVVKPDDTPPETVYASFEDPVLNDDHYDCNVHIEAKDPDCRMLYYSYSVDGGVHFSKRLRWESTAPYSGGGDGIDVTVPLPDGRDIFLIIRAYNLYNLYTDSESYYIPALDEIVIEEEVVEEPEEPVYDEISRPEEEHEEEPKFDLENDFIFVALLGGIAVCILIMALVLAYIIYGNSRRKNRRRRN